MRKMVTAMKLNVKHIANGFYNLATGRKHSLSKFRINICKGCPHYRKKFFVLEICAMCGCFLKAKTRVVNENCPIERW